MKRFLDLGDCTREEVLSLLELARRLERQPEPHALAGKVLGLLFFNPSLRTLASFAGGHGAPRRQLLRHHPGPGQLAARDPRAAS